MFPKSFKSKLLALIICISVVVVLRLFLVASETDNLRGAFYSSVHTILVGLGAYLALKNYDHTS